MALLLEQERAQVALDYLKGESAASIAERKTISIQHVRVVAKAVCKQALPGLYLGFQPNSALKSLREYKGNFIQAIEDKILSEQTKAKGAVEPGSTKSPAPMDGRETVTDIAGLCIMVAEVTKLQAAKTPEEHPDAIAERLLDRTIEKLRDAGMILRKQ